MCENNKMQNYLTTICLAVYGVGLLSQFFLHSRNSKTLKNHGFMINSLYYHWYPFWLFVIGSGLMMFELGVLPKLKLHWNLLPGLLIFGVGAFLRVKAQLKLGHYWVMGDVIDMEPDLKKPQRNVRLGRVLELFGLFLTLGAPGTAAVISLPAIFLMQSMQKKHTN